jgi:hypothetical protein
MSARMPACSAGSATGMEREFSIPARVVEATNETPQEVDPDTDELLPAAHAATDDGTPLSRATEPVKQLSR